MRILRCSCFPDRHVRVIRRPRQSSAEAFYSLYEEVETGQPGFRRSRFVLDALCYGVALLLLAAIRRHTFAVAPVDGISLFLFLLAFDHGHE